MARSKAELSEYEIQRQANIAKNKELLKELQLNALSTGLAPKAQKPKSSSTNGAPRKKATARKVKEEDLAPRRTSSRIRGIQADSEVAKRKAEEDLEAQREAERAKRQRVSKDLKLGDIVVSGQNWNHTGNWLSNVGPSKPYERTFDKEEAVKATSSKELKELREKMSGLELWEAYEPSRIKLTPERIYSMTFHPTADKALVFAADKLGNVGLLDSSQAKIKKEEDAADDELAESNDDDNDDGPPITTFRPHTRTISCMHFTPSMPKALYTSSYDSSIRRVDLEKGVSTEVYGPSDLEVEEPVSGFTMPEDDPHMIYFATLNGSFGMHDTRTKSSETGLMQLSEKKIGGISIHPRRSYLLATASLDRTCKLWDLRKISGRGSARLPHLVAEHESRLSVSHAAFNSFGQIATSSYDDTIKIYSLPTASSSWTPGITLGEGEFEPSAVVPHNNQTGRWVTILRPHWQRAPTAVGGGTARFCIGNMNRFVDIYDGSGAQLAQLGGEGITAVPAVTLFHPSMDWVAGGTASGKLALWM